MTVFLHFFIEKMDTQKLTNWMKSGNWVSKNTIIKCLKVTTSVTSGSCLERVSIINLFSSQLVVCLQLGIVNPVRCAFLLLYNIIQSIVWNQKKWFVFYFILTATYKFLSMDSPRSANVSILN